MRTFKQEAEDWLSELVDLQTDSNEARFIQDATDSASDNEEELSLFLVHGLGYEEDEADDIVEEIKERLLSE